MLKPVKMISGLCLLVTIWPVMSLPLHLLLVRHHFCSLHAHGLEYSDPEEENSCSICSFEFCWKFSDPEKIKLNREDILLFIKSEPLVVFYYNIWQHHIQLRGPPSTV